jgi:hypothetical protein
VIVVPCHRSSECTCHTVCVCSTLG